MKGIIEGLLYVQGDLGLTIDEVSDILEIDKDTNIEELYNNLKNDNLMLVEEYLIQHEKMNKLYDKSVNTLRIIISNILITFTIPNSLFKRFSKLSWLSIIVIFIIYSIGAENITKSCWRKLIPIRA